MSTVSAVIPTWNRADLIRSLLANLKGQTRAPDRILVIDNGSTDETKEETDRAGAEWVGLPVNRGFAFAVNEGVRRAATDWVLIINNDVVLERDWLERILEAAEDTGRCICRRKTFSRRRR